MYMYTGQSQVTKEIRGTNQTTKQILVHVHVAGVKYRNVFATKS